MKQLFINFLYLLFLCIFLFSCKKKPFQRVDFSGGDVSMYFIIPPGFEYSSDFQKKHKNFYIVDKTTLESIKQLANDQVKRKINSPSFYILQVKKGDEVLEGAILYVENDLLFYYNGAYDFDFSELEKHSKHFKRLSSFEVNCVTASATQDFIAYVKQTDGFLSGEELSAMPAENYVGKIELLTDSYYINNKDLVSWENIEKAIVKDFPHPEKIKVNYYSFRNDSVIVKLLMKEDLTSEIPKEYKILKPFTDTLNLPLHVLNLEKEEIVNFFKSHGYQDFEIKDLNADLDTNLPIN